VNTDYTSSVIELSMVKSIAIRTYNNVRYMIFIRYPIQIKLRNLFVIQISRTKQSALTETTQNRLTLCLVNEGILTCETSYECHNKYL